jgi:hypothetical protein
LASHRCDFHLSLASLYYGLHPFVFGGILAVSILASIPCRLAFIVVLV